MENGGRPNKEETSGSAGDVGGNAKLESYFKREVLFLGGTCFIFVGNMKFVIRMCCFNAVDGVLDQEKAVSSAWWPKVKTAMTNVCRKSWYMPGI
jgi:hypothetical protein